MSSAKLTVTSEQVAQLVEQLSEADQQAIGERLSRKRWTRWIAASAGAEDEARRLAKDRGLDWDAMDDGQRLAFVDDLIHDDNGRRS